VRKGSGGKSKKTGIKEGFNIIVLEGKEEEELR